VTYAGIGVAVDGNESNSSNGNGNACNDTCNSDYGIGKLPFVYFVTVNVCGLGAICTGVCLIMKKICEKYTLSKPGRECVY
jgi:hypothetical protein